MAKKHIRPVVRLFLAGSTRQEIAEALSIPYSTVCYTLKIAGTPRWYDRAPNAQNEAIRKQARVRDAEVLRLRKSGAKFREIGEKFGISRQQAYSLYARALKNQSE